MTQQPEHKQKVAAVYDSFEFQVANLSAALNDARTVNDAARQAILRALHEHDRDQKLPDNLLTDKGVLEKFIGDKHGKGPDSVQAFLDSFQEELKGYKKGLTRHPLLTYKTHPTLVDNPPLNPERLDQLQDKILKPLFMKSGNKGKSIIPRSPLEKGFTLSKYMWIAILDDLLDPNIAEITYRSRGHNDGDNRIDKTSDFFGGTVQKFKLKDVIDKVNLMHEYYFVMERDQDGKPGVKEEYKESFTYVLSSLIERMRDFYDIELGMHRNTPEGDRIAQNLCDLWYGIAKETGLHDRPKTLADHEAFVRNHEAYIIPERNKKPEQQAQVQQMTRNFMPKIAETANCSDNDVIKLIKEIRPELTSYLALNHGNDKWPTENRRKNPGVLGTARKAVGLFTGYVNDRIMGPKEEDRTLKKLRRAGEQPNHDMAIRALFHLARKQKDMHLESLPLHLKPGDPLIEEGKPDYLYVLLSTDKPLEVMRHNAEDGTETHLKTIMPGEPTILGEGMFRARANESVKAGQEDTRVEVVRVTKDQLSELLKGEEGKYLKRTLATMMQERAREYEGTLGR